jgi:chromosome segregation ATPase
MAYVTRGTHYPTSDTLRTHSYPSSSPATCGCIDCRNLRQAIKAELELKHVASNACLVAEINGLNNLVARYESKSESRNCSQTELELNNTYLCSRIKHLEKEIEGLKNEKREWKMTDREVEVLKKAKRDWKATERHLVAEIEGSKKEKGEWKIAKRNLLAELEGLKKERREWKNAEYSLLKEVEGLKNEKREAIDSQYNLMMQLQNMEIAQGMSAEDTAAMTRDIIAEGTRTGYANATDAGLDVEEATKKAVASANRRDDLDNQSNGKGYGFGNFGGVWSGFGYR